jgi:hypothetical protein
MTLNRIHTLILIGLLLGTALTDAQITPVAAPPVPYASVSELNGLLASLEQASQTTQTDLSRLRIEKWKMDSGYKKQTLSNTESVRRNLQTALPEIMTQLRNSPEDLGASFKLYRNLDALYDVLGNVAESAGAFGSKDEFQSLSSDLNAFERSRRAFADRMEGLTTAKESELCKLRLRRLRPKRLLSTTMPQPSLWPRKRSPCRSRPRRHRLQLARSPQVRLSRSRTSSNQWHTRVITSM